MFAKFCSSSQASAWIGLFWYPCRVHRHSPPSYGRHLAVQSRGKQTNRLAGPAGGATIARQESCAWDGVGVVIVASISGQTLG